MIYLDPQQTRVYKYIKDHPGERMDKICHFTRASKSSMRISEINYKSRQDIGEDLIITTSRDKHRWCHKGLNKNIKVKEKVVGDRLELTLSVK